MELCATDSLLVHIACNTNQNKPQIKKQNQSKHTRKVDKQEGEWISLSWWRALKGHTQERIQELDGSWKGRNGETKEKIWWD